MDPSRGYEPVIFHQGVHEPDGARCAPHPVITFPGNHRRGGRRRILRRVMHVRTAQMWQPACRPQSNCCRWRYTVYQNCLEPYRFRPSGMAIPAEDSPLAKRQRQGARVFGAYPRRRAITIRIRRRGAITGRRWCDTPSTVPQHLPMEWSVIKRVILGSRPHDSRQRRTPSFAGARPATPVLSVASTTPVPKRACVQLRRRRPIHLATVGRDHRRFVGGDIRSYRCRTNWPKRQCLSWCQCPR
jgi:hypothetical protein